MVSSYCNTSEDSAVDLLKKGFDPDVSSFAVADEKIPVKKHELDTENVSVGHISSPVSTASQAMQSGFSEISSTASSGNFSQCNEKKRKRNKTAKDKRWWTPEEDARLRAIVETHGPRNWKAVSKLVGTGRSDIQCLQRWRQVLRPGLKKGSWTKTEDERLALLVRHHLTYASGFDRDRIPWKRFEEAMGGRTAKQCRERWMLTLNPKINKMPWTQEEDQQLLIYQNRLGNSWSQIKALLGTNRSENAVKLRFKSLMKRLREQTPIHRGKEIFPDNSSNINFVYNTSRKPAEKRRKLVASNEDLSWQFNEPDVFWEFEKNKYNFFNLMDDFTFTEIFPEI